MGVILTVIFFIVITVLWLVSLVFFGGRNRKVYELRIEIGNKCHLYNIANIKEVTEVPESDAWRWCTDQLPSYDAMLYQFWRPLTLEEWIPKDKLDRLLENGAK